MTINWQEFTPITSLIGGVILGLGAVFLIIFKGRIAGISGIVGALMQFQNTPKDHHPSKMCHRVIADNIIKSIERDI